MLRSPNAMVIQSFHDLVANGITNGIISVTMPRQSGMIPNSDPG